MTRAGIAHVDLVVGSLQRSLPFYRELLAPLGYTGADDIVGERGETVWYLSIPGRFEGSLGLREASSRVDGAPHDRYGVAFITSASTPARATSWTSASVGCASGAP